MIKSDWRREEEMKLISVQKAESKVLREQEQALIQAEIDTKQREEDEIIAEKKAAQDKKDDRMREKMALVQKKKLAKLVMSLEGNASLLGDCKRS
jgi:hypothetical protein